MPVKNLDLTDSLKARLAAYSFDERVSMASVIREVIVDYAEGLLDVSIEQLTVEVKYTAPAEYEMAMIRANREGIALADVIRAGLDLRLPQ